MATARKKPAVVTPPEPPPSWKDVSSFSRSDTDRTPKAFEYRTKSLRISVHRSIYGAKVDWFVTCYDVRIEKHPLAAMPAEEAMTEGMAHVKARLAAMISELP